MLLGVALCLALLAAPAAGQEAAASTVEEPDLVVLPFANYSGKFEALSTVLPVFYSRLDSLGLRVLDHESLRPLLREHRIRVVGQIGARAMDIIAAASGARFAVVGSIDIYEPDAAFEVMISARLVDLQTHGVIAALSVGRTVQETERAFGVGRAEEIAQVISPVVEEFMERLRPALLGVDAHPRRYHKCGLVAVVPLEDYSERRHGAEVLQNLLITELVARDWEVVEPGVVHEILLDAQKVVRGGVSTEVLGILREEIGVCLVVTGDLEEFSSAPSDLPAAIPRIDYGLRLIDARSARLLASIDRSRDGMEGESLFQIGREHSMQRMVRHSMARVVEWIAEEGDQ